MLTVSSLRNDFHLIMQLIVNQTRNGQKCFFEVGLGVSHLHFLETWLTILPLNSLPIKISSQLQFATGQNLFQYN